MNRVIERVLNLLAFLLTVGRPVTADEIRHTVAGYDQDTDEAFRRTFERDKDLLRQLGVPMRMEHTDAWEVEQGYVVAPDEYALADAGLTDEERTALWIAATMVHLGGQAAGPAAIFKLGGSPALAAGEPLTADLGAEGEALAELFGAVSTRRVVSFVYRDKKRKVSPYGLAHRRGHWYVVGGTPDGTRVFRVDRMLKIKVGDSHAPWTAGEDDVVVDVRFDAGVAWWARRQLTSTAQVTDGSDGSITARFPVAHVEAFIGWLISFDDQAEILGPDEIRRRFVDHLTAAS